MAHAPMPVLVLVGVTGDLAKRKLLPALWALSARGELPFGRIIGTSRRPRSADELLLDQDPLRDVFEVAELVPEGPRSYAALAARLAGAGGEAFFYLALPPGTAGTIAEGLAGAGCGGTLVLEKPFGMDGASAGREAARIRAAFGAKVVRVDHYLGKPLVARLAQRAPGRTAGRVDVIAAEALGLQGRIDFYDATGALRDAGNHLLSLLCAALGAMTPEERLRELQQLAVVGARRGQYEGYAAEVGHPTDTETLVALTLSHSGYPELSIRLASGKALGAKQTVVRTQARDGAMAELAEEANDQDAHERLFPALVRGEGALFLSEAEALESWRLIDAARAAWGGVEPYAQGGGTAALMA